MVWLTRVRVKGHDVLEGHRIVGKLIIPIHRKGYRTSCNNYWGISFLNHPGKVHVKCLVERWREIIEPKLDGTQCGFRGLSTTEQNSTLQQFSRNLGSMQKTNTHVLSKSGKCMTGFLVKNFGQCCWSMVLTAVC